MNTNTFSFFLHSGDPYIPAKITQDWIGRIEAHLPPIEHITIIICTDEELLTMNNSFLQHDYYTDILTFDMRASVADRLEAELYISVDRVKDNAEVLHTSFENEFHRVIIHGILHLCGHSDKTAEDQQQMRQAEDRYLKL